MTTIAVESKSISRREFLYYVWGASGALALTGACGLAAWYLLPDQRLTPANGYYRVTSAMLPIVNQPPARFEGTKISGHDKNFWLVNDPNGLFALSPICTYRRCGVVYKWVDLNYRFECPNCGSKFQADGTHIEGPASRSLDRYTIYVTTPTERRQTPPDSSPVRIDDATEIIVYTRRIIKGTAHP